jgi:hypothetical protein
MRYAKNGGKKKSKNKTPKIALKISEYCSNNCDGRKDCRQVKKSEEM